MKKILTLLLAASMLITLVAGCGTTSSSSASTPVAAAVAPAKPKTVVKVGTNNMPNPPFSYVDDKNNRIGYTVDYLKELEKKLPEYEFQYEAVDGNSMLLGVDSGKYAFAANYYFKNPSREQKYLFPDHEFGYSITALVTKSSRNDIKTLDDLVGKKLTPVTPTSGLTYVLKDYNAKHPDKQITLEYIDTSTEADNLKWVASGKYDAHFINAHNFENTNKQLKLDLKNAGIISKEPVWILFNKSQTELAKKIDAATVELLNDGTLSKLAEKWFTVDFFKSIDYINQGYQFKK